MNTKKFTFRPGWVIADCSKAYGGIKYEREDIEEREVNRGRGMQTEYVTHKTIDHVEFCSRIDAVVKKADYVLRKHCVRTEMGWFTDDAGLKKVQGEIEELRKECEALHQHGPQVRSERRAKIHIVPLKLDLDHREAVIEITATIRSVLTDLRDALRQGDIASLHKLKLRGKNLEQLATGFQSDAIRFALERVAGAANEIRQALSTGSTYEEAGKDLDLEIFDAALAHFEDSIYG